MVQTVRHHCGSIDVLVNVDEVDDRARWESIVGLTNRIQARAEESEFRKLMIEENLFKAVEIGGVLRSTGTFDIASIAVEPEEYPEG